MAARPGHHMTPVTSVRLFDLPVPRNQKSELPSAVSAAKTPILAQVRVRGSARTTDVSTDSCEGIGLRDRTTWRGLATALCECAHAPFVTVPEHARRISAAGLNGRPPITTEGHRRPGTRAGSAVIGAGVGAGGRRGLRDVFRLSPRTFR